MRVYLYLVILFFLVSCGNDLANDDGKIEEVDSTKVSSTEAKIIEPKQDEEIVVLKKNGIQLTEVKGDQFPDAILKLTNNQFKEGLNSLNFSVDGVDDYAISFIVNNYMLTKHASTIIESELLDGNNVFLAFLTDKNGIGIKTNKALVLKNVVLGNNEHLFDMTKPHLFYYMPESNSDEVVLDFCLLNTTISEKGNKVKVVLNNETEFILSKWAAYKIKGLSKESNIIRIQLINKEGKLIEGPFNDSGDRGFTIKKSL